MTDQTSRIFTDDTVASAVLDIIRGARDHVILVSPYNKFWDHLRNELRLALGRGVKVIYLCRQDEETEDIHWLGRQGATVYAVEMLHAKLFMNESSVILASMNLHESSTKNSKEVALSITDQSTKTELLNYVERLMQLGHQIYPRPATTKARPTTTSRPSQGGAKSRRRSGSVGQAPSSVPTWTKVWHTLRVAATGGRCIRCERPIVYDLERPLCDDCFKVRNRYQNRDHTEIACHRCGRKWETTYGKPICLPCFQEVNR